MINTNFYLKEFESKTGNQVYAKLYDPNSKKSNIRIGLKTRIFRKCWDKTNQVVIPNKPYTKEEVRELNQALTDFRKKIDKIIYTIELRGENVTSAKVKSLFESDMADLKTEIAKEDLRNRYIDDFYKPYAMKFHYRSSPHIGYKAFVRFQNAKGRKKLRDINYELMKEYADWLATEIKNADSTITQRINKLKYFITTELKRKTKIDESYIDYKHSFDESDIFRLTIEQFSAFYKVNNLSKHLKEIKDCFILMTCFGGIRISSALKLDSNSLNRNEKTVTYLEMKKKVKRREEKSITNPLNLFAIEILEERNWTLPKFINGVHLNRGLKEIIKLSDLKNEYFVVDDDEEKNVKKYLREEISSKTARKTFVSINEDFAIIRAVSNKMSNHSTKSREASDRYRLDDPKVLWQKKLEVVNRWNAEYYKLFPSRIPANNKQILKLANGKEAILVNNQLIFIQ